MIDRILPLDVSRWALALLAVAALAGCGIGTTDAERLARARASMKAGEHRAAMIDLKDLLQRDPENLEARVALGEASLRAGDNATAVRELRFALGAGASADVVLPQLVAALVAREEYEEALQAADVKAVGQSQAKSALHRFRGSALGAMNRHAEALAEFEAALQLDPQDVAAVHGLAEATMVISGLERALAQLERAEGIDAQNVGTRLTRGSLYLRAQRFEQAAAAFAEARALAVANSSTPAERAALGGLTEAHLGAGRVEAALETARRMRERGPPTRASHYLQARVFFMAGRLEESRTLLEELISYDPGNRKARLLLGAVSYAEGNLGQADMYLASVVASDPDNAFARQLLAETRLRQNKTQDALEALLPATRGADADPRLLASAGRVKLRAGDIDGALAMLDRGVELTETDAAARLDLAAGYLAAGQTATAARLLEALPESASGRREYLLIATRVRQQDRAGAIAIARQVVTKLPREPNAHIMHAALLSADKKFAEARASLEIARTLAPASAAIPLNLGRLAALQGATEEAEEQFKKVLESHPAHPGACAALAQLALARGDSRQAVQWLEQARKANPRAVEPRVQLALLLVASRDFAGAETAAREAIVLEPANTRAIGALAVALSGAGKHPDAIAVLKHAADAAPKSAQAQVNLARAYLLAARPEEAAAALRNALARDGNHYPALLMSATLASREGWSPELEATLARMKAIAPDESHAYLIEAEHLMQTRQEKKAARALEAAIARRPQDAVALNNLAWLYHTLRDDRALDVARRAYAIAGGRAEIADTYGWLLVESGRVPDGLQILRQVGGPGAPEEIRLHLAQALARNGAVKEARQIAAELAAGPVGSKAVNGAQALLGRLGGG